MKRIIRLTENDLSRIVKRVLSEQKITDIRKGRESDPYEYGAEYGKCIKYYSRKKGTQEWVLGDEDQQYAIWKYYFCWDYNKKTGMSCDEWSKSCADQGVK